MSTEIERPTAAPPHLPRRRVAAGLGSIAALLALLLLAPFGATLPVSGGTSESADARDILIRDVYINATPQQIWDAITSSEWTTRYGYRGPVDYELEPGGAYRAHATAPLKAMGMPDVVVDGEVIEAHPPSKLVQTYRFLFNESTEAEGFTRLTWEIDETGAGFSRLRLTHRLEGAPIMAGMVSSEYSQIGAGGWSWILSDLKSVLETGKALGDK